MAAAHVQYTQCDVYQFIITSMYTSGKVDNIDNNGKWYVENHNRCPGISTQLCQRRHLVNAYEVNGRYGVDCR